MSQKILFQFKEYEEYAIEFFIQPNNGFWSGSLTLYLNKTDIIKLIDDLKKFDGTKEKSILFELGEDDNSTWAYYFKMEIHPIDYAGKTEINFIIQDNNLITDGKRAEFSMHTYSAEINKFGEKIKTGFSSLELIECPIIE